MLRLPSSLAVDILSRTQPDQRVGATNLKGSLSSLVEDWLFKDEMNAVVKLGGGCAALARMQAGIGRVLDPHCSLMHVYVERSLALALNFCSYWQPEVGPKRPLTNLFTAFSRPGDGKPKCYVQERSYMDLKRSNG